MDTKILVPAKSAKQKALNIFLENGDLLDRTYATSAMGNKSDLKISLYLVDVPPTEAILFKFEGYLENSLYTWQNGLRNILHLERYNNSTLQQMYLKQAANIHRIIYVNDINELNVYIETLLPLLT